MRTFHAQQQLQETHVACTDQYHLQYQLYIPIHQLPIPIASVQTQMVEVL